MMGGTMNLAEALHRATAAFQEFNRVWIAGSAWEQWKRSAEAQARLLK
jgi:hypothetical protein